MNKKEMIKAISKQAGITNTAARVALDAFIVTAVEVLGRGEKIVLSNFGSLSVKKRVARPGRNMKTGETIALPAGKTVRFRVSNHLKRAVNKKED